MLDFLTRWPELKSLKAARPASLRAFYAAHNSRHAGVIAGRLTLIDKARALTEDRAVIEPAMLEVKMLVDLLRPLQQNIALIEEHISKASKPIPRRICSVDCRGRDRQRRPVYSPPSHGPLSIP